jgi:hypothetical protein
MNGPDTDGRMDIDTLEVIEEATRSASIFDKHRRFPIKRQAEVGTRPSPFFPAFFTVFSIVLASSSSAPAQIFGSNLIVNGHAEAGPADSSGASPVSSIP